MIATCTQNSGLLMLFKQKRTIVAKDFRGYCFASALCLTGMICGLQSGVASSQDLLSALGDSASFYDKEIISTELLTACMSATHEAQWSDESRSSRCVAGRAFNLMLDKATHLVNETARENIGNHFHVANKLNYSPSDNSVKGDLDVVVPLSFQSSTPTGANRTGLRQGSWFVQHGVTTWKDEQSFRRNDLRLGMVRRKLLDSRFGTGIVGVSAFVQQNAERGHRRLVTSIDYAGKWGKGFFNSFQPLTNWKAGRRGFDERPAEGMEIGVRFDATTTIAVETAYTRWEDKKRRGVWNSGGRIGFNWRPHTWLTVGANYSEHSRSDDASSFVISFMRPLGGGGRQETPRWSGFGEPAGGSVPKVSDLWRAVEDIGRIRMVEREASDENGLTEIEGVEVQFLQNSVVSGNEVLLEVTIPTPLAKDTRLVLRLVPGTGSNPAVPGEDFTDEPIDVLLSAGETSIVVAIPLLFNNNMKNARSLDVRVFRSA